MLAEYLEAIYQTYRKGDAREESYYFHLQKLINDFAHSINRVVDITVLPKPTEAGNPDFRIWDGKLKICGYIEAKTIGTRLDVTEDSLQLSRYLKTFPNLILTNFTEFRFYRNGEIFGKVSIARPFILEKLHRKPPVENIDEFSGLLEKFLMFSLPQSYTANALANELAKRTRFLKDAIIQEELKNGTRSVHEFYNAFKEFLIGGISEEDFADLYSQTITYGLFAARLRAEAEFNRKTAYSYIPKSIGILRDIFKFISVEDMPPQMELIIDDIAEVLAVVDVKKLLEKFYHEGKGNDPVLHFYETFLAVYDPKTREKRGVYYTPDAVVSYIVQSVNSLLKDKLGKTEGLASEDLVLLDPAGGTLGFLGRAIEVAVADYKKLHGDGTVKQLIKERILRNFYSFELMMAPYAIGHIKMSFLLEELGYKMHDDERVKYYLTNTLEMQELEQSRFPGMSSLSKESHEAGRIKTQMPVLVVLGNPPYSGHSSNNGEWISEILNDYYFVDGQPLGEKNPKWLQDDYVKFIRFAQWKIEQAGEGIVGFITNHSYLDNPTFRGMRQSLMNTFDEIYIFDLHGNTLKKEVAPDGGKDENVFDIQQGVAIAFFVKYKSSKVKKVYHSELFGTRKSKYEYLKKSVFKKEKWRKLNPSSDYYLFVPRNESLQNDYKKFKKITEIFPVNSVGVVTARDEFLIDKNKNALLRRIESLRDEKIPDYLFEQTYHLKNSSKWDLSKKRKNLLSEDNIEDYITEILYRPFDMRYVFYHPEFIERTRFELMQHLLHENLALCVGRQSAVVGSSGYDIVLITKSIVDLNLFRRGGELVFPLYIYKETTNRKKTGFAQLLIFEPVGTYQTKVPNIESGFYSLLEKQYNTKITPEQILYYIYAVLFSNIYRKMFAEFLKNDFPKIPFTKNFKCFCKLAALGERLSSFHLLMEGNVKKSTVQFPIPGNSVVEKPNWCDGKIFINDLQYFSSVSLEVWKYHIGGYNVCEKWLKMRKSHSLSLDEIETFGKIITAIKETIETQGQIDVQFLLIGSDVI